MTPAIESLLAAVIEREGGFVDHPDDRGGPTNWGITQATLAAVRGAHVTKDDVRALSRDQALAIYRQRYVADPGFDRVSAISPAIAAELVDTGVNMGPAAATKLLQRCLNALNLRGALYPDMGEPDGRIGQVTLAALRTYLGARQRDGERVLLRALNCLQGARYFELAEKNPSQESFLYGWLLHRVS